LLRGGFDPLPQRTISDRRPLASMTERHAVQPWLLQGEPVQYFRQYFHLTLLNPIVEQAHFYAAQCNSNFHITETELETFLGTLLKMGHVPMPRYSMYWSTELRFDVTVDAVSRNRFHEVVRFLHFNDKREAEVDRESPCYDRLFKVRPLIESIRQSYLRLEHGLLRGGFDPLPQRTISDRRPLASMTERHAVQPWLLQGEPVQYFRQYFHLTLLNPIVEQAHFYAAQCNSNFHITETELETFLGTLLKMGHVPMPRYSMYWSTELRCDVTVDANDSAKQTEERATEKEIELKRAAWGAFHVCTTAESNLCIVRWHDSAVVNLSSTYVCTHPVCKVKR
ncbi:PiggyBac transposable element-derived protein 2, partial [Trichinella britovi]